LSKYVAIQPHYNLMSRETYEGERAALAAEHGLSAIPYYALASGFLTGKYRPGDRDVDSGRPGVAGFLESARGVKVLEALDTVAAAHGAEVSSVALAWLAAQPTVVTPLASARTPGQLPALLAFADLELTPQELNVLTEASSVAG
jgi:aryl-alcohol dehydrogenase-like predicted oxidoreductase